MEKDRVADGYTKANGTPNYCKNKQWWFSVIVYIFGVILDFVAVSLIPSTISLPVGSIGLAISAICANTWLHESFKLTDLFGTLLIIAGAWFIVGFSNKELELLTIEKINQKMTDTHDTPIWFFVGALIFLAVNIIISYIWKNAVTFAMIPGVCGTFTILFGSCIG